MKNREGKMSFAEILEAVDTMDYKEQDLLFELIQKRRIDKRRQEILLNANETFNAIELGEAKKGSLDDLLKDLED